MNESVFTLNKFSEKHKLNWTIDKLLRTYQLLSEFIKYQKWYL